MKRRLPGVRIWAAAWALVCFCAAQPAAAGESGRFELHESYVHDYTTMQHAGVAITGGALRGTGVIVRSSGGPFPEGGSYGITCLVYAKKSKKGMDLEAPCTLTDSSGDMLHLMAIRRAGDV